jgi:hypothetical protein
VVSARRNERRKTVLLILRGRPVANVQAVETQSAATYPPERPLSGYSIRSTHARLGHASSPGGAPKSLNIEGPHPACQIRCVTSRQRPGPSMRFRRYLNCLTFRPTASGEPMLRLCRRGPCTVNCCEAYLTSRSSRGSGGTAPRRAVAGEDLEFGLAGDIELPAKHRHILTI